MVYHKLKCFSNCFFIFLKFFQDIKIIFFIFFFFDNILENLLKPLDFHLDLLSSFLDILYIRNNLIPLFYLEKLHIYFRHLSTSSLINRELRNNFRRSWWRNSFSILSTKFSSKRVFPFNRLVGLSVYSVNHVFHHCSFPV